MPLAAGQSLSFYEILGPLGAGGMGEVYRARDTRLERDVAIKVLPEELADDEERLRRFEREAKTLASLSHTNVAGIHGVDQEQDVCFLALELVPGEDLAAVLARGDDIRVVFSAVEPPPACHASGSARARGHAARFRANARSRSMLTSRMRRSLAPNRAFRPVTRRRGAERGASSSRHRVWRLVADAESRHRSGGTRAAAGAASEKPRARARRVSTYQSVTTAGSCVSGEGVGCGKVIAAATRRDALSFSE